MSGATFEPTTAPMPATLPSIARVNPVMLVTAAPLTISIPLIAASGFDAVSPVGVVKMRVTPVVRFKPTPVTARVALPVDGKPISSLPNITSE